MGLLVTHPWGMGHQQVILTSSLVYILEGELAEGHLSNYGPAEGREAAAMLQPGL